MSGDWNPGEASDTGRTDEEHEGEIEHGKHCEGKVT